MRVFLLDMGDEMYGDAILVTEGERTILVDGGHPGDWRRRSRAPSIPEQLTKILKRAAPFDIDLLVVTHCHSDHIGCLPKLVEDETITVQRALVADEALGFPEDEQDGGPLGDRMTETLVAALREEPRPEMDAAALDDFLADAVRLADRYRTMLATLEERGTKIVRYRGAHRNIRALEREFQDVGLRVLGPTRDHLQKCSEAIRAFDARARDAIASLRREDRDGVLTAAPLYRLLTRERIPTDARLPDGLRAFLDRPGKGAALNNQSIMLRLGLETEAVLLTGDMQLAAPEVDGLDEEMDALLDTIVAAGPYNFIKLPHHASYNGLDERVLDRFEGTPAFGITTGRRDPTHPHPDVLRLLNQRRDELTWVRTDKNGLVEIRFDNGDTLLGPTRGETDDASPNARDEVPPPEELEAGAQPLLAPAVPQAPEEPAGGAGMAVQALASGAVEVVARIPHTATRVTITIDVEPRPGSQPNQDRGGGRGGPALGPAADRLAGGRALPPLLFVTDQARLEANIGRAEAQEAMAVIRGGGQAVVDLGQAPNPHAALRAAAQQVAGLAGIVILGGYDVVPAERYDTLPPSLRDQLDASADADPDDFIVWSDQVYGDTNGDGLADLPISRIPDGRSPQLVMSALAAPQLNPRAARFGLRNAERPFADEVFTAQLDGTEAMLPSRPSRSHAINGADMDAKLVYLMLHGSDADGTRFWGETAHGMLEALFVGNIPDPCGGVVFAGCCWGALTVRERALVHRTGDPLQILTPSQSLALTFLTRGARAFVGCTGAHYSPLERPLNYFGAPMHHSFWRYIRAGRSPASALFQAKLDYIQQMPHGRFKIEERAIENKILRQFTCLGLGW